jgi:hypothetical protein
MDDDIVTRLRTWAGMFKGGHARQITLEAADEIQRLRRELALLRMVRLSEELGLYELDADDAK